MITGILLQQVNFTLSTAPLLETLLVNFSLKSHTLSFFPCHVLYHFRTEILFESGLVVISATTLQADTLHQF